MLSSPSEAQRAAAVLHAKQEVVSERDGLFPQQECSFSPRERPASASGEVTLLLSSISFSCQALGCRKAKPGSSSCSSSSYCDVHGIQSRGQGPAQLLVAASRVVLPQRAGVDIQQAQRLLWASGHG